jgi:hypothetical protein
MKTKTLSTGVLVLTMLLAACLPEGKQIPSTQGIADVQTAAVQTVEARFTLEAGQTAVAKLTQIAGQSTATPPPSTQPPTPTSTVTLKPSPTPPLPTAIPQLPCDQAEFVQDVTIQPDTILLSGAMFTKTWRVRNSGSCTWTVAYALVFTSGYNLSGVQAIALPATIQPGQMIDLSALMLAPTSPGTYQGFWALQNSSDAIFGSGTDSNNFLETRIRVIQSVAWQGNTYDMSVNYCTATWQSQTGVLNCQGASQDANGWALLLAQPVLESGSSEAYGLWTHPNNSVDGWISGQFSNYVVNPGDHFLTEIGCAANTPGCDLVFQVDYQTSDGQAGTIGRWRETFDGKSTRVNIDLSSLAGRTTMFTLIVRNRGSVANADGIWLLPRIQNLAFQGNLALTWIREVERTTSCKQLNIYANSDKSFEARAYSCLPDQQELGRTNLTSAEVFQLLATLQRLKSFAGEIYLASPSQPVLISIILRSPGDGDAADSDIRAISSFAEAIFNRIVP